MQLVLALEHPGFQVEVNVVDDGSTDRTAAIAREHGARGISQARRGVSGARQAVFEAARGEIIVSMDADTAPPRDWLVRLVAELRVPGVVGVYGPIRLSDGKGYVDWASRWLTGAFFWLNSCIRRPTFSGAEFRSPARSVDPRRRL
jgi:cellulose synthase/poly-beta-1,6-N-acetylglucosamine synthase-like glycosyltransferase